MCSITIRVPPLYTLQNEAAGSCRPDSPPLALILQSLWATLSQQPFIFSSPYVQGFILSSPYVQGFIFSSPYVQGFIFSSPYVQGFIFSSPYVQGLIFSFLSRVSFLTLKENFFLFQPLIHCSEQVTLTVLKGELGTATKRSVTQRLCHLT